MMEEESLGVGTVVTIGWGAVIRGGSCLIFLQEVRMHSFF